MTEYKLRDGSIVQDPRLDRIEEFDNKSRKYPIRALHAGKKERSYTWRCNLYLDQGRSGCHKEGTEILTDRGWLDFRYLKKDDLLATVNPKTLLMEFQPSISLIKYEYNGKMVEMDSKTLKFSVTPEHRMWVRPWNEKKRSLGGKYKFVDADHLGWYSGLLPSPRGYREGKELQSIKIGKNIIDGDVFVEFMGIFIADGCVNYVGNGSYRIQIAASKGRKRDFFEKILNALGYTVSSYDDRYIIHNKELFSFLKKEVGICAPTKIIPRWIRNLPERQIKLFINAFCEGDGYTNKKTGAQIFYTSSKKIADGLQEMFLKIQKKSSLAVATAKDVYISNRKIKKENCSAQYVISPYSGQVSSIERKRQIKYNHYIGNVYCATVPNSILITRYKGTTLISGNSCVGNGITHELAARPAEVKGLTEQFAVKKIYWPAQREDNFPGGAYPGASPRYEGTSVLAGIRVAQALGYFEEYRWAFSLEDLIMGVGHNGPAVCGFRWREGMMQTDSNGFIHATGEEVGGHCTLTRAVNIKKQYFTIRNSWGPQWGEGGDCKISFDDMELLLNSRADAAFFLHRHCEGNVP